MFLFMLFILLYWFIYVIKRFITPYQHTLTVSINMTARQINSYSVVPNAVVVSPYHTNMFCTLPTQTEPLYN